MKERRKDGREEDKEEGKKSTALGEVCVEVTQGKE